MALVITNNSPSAGYVAWTGMVVTYKGVDHNINNDNSNKKYIWWDLDNPTDLQESDTLPTLTDDDSIIIVNISGTHYLWKNRTVRGEVINLTSWRQDDTSDSYKEKVIVQHGWGFKLGDSTNQMNEAVTFPIEFSNKPVVIAQAAGLLAGSDPTEEDDLTNIGTFHARAYLPTTTGFTIDLSTVSRDGNSPGVFASTSRFGYKWIAIGTVA